MNETESRGYDFDAIETKWQAYWEEHKTFKTLDFLDKPKLYVLDMFPYPSGSGLHVGHPEGYTATDIYCRYKRMAGFNVLHPMGWDAFGLPAEQYAIKTGTHPSVTTNQNCDTFRRQIKRLGLSYDWDREINTTDVKYYKWTQWIFTKLYDTWFDESSQKGRPISELPIPESVQLLGNEAVKNYISEKRLAYFAEAKVWFCDHCRTVCANEEILNDGSHEKCATKNVRRLGLRQWQLRIPFYAERLLAGLDNLNWPEGIKEMQRNWIGRSTGAEVDFKIDGSDKTLRVYTTRPDTLFGATYMVVSPEHEFLADITAPEQKAAVNAYAAAAALKSDLERTELSKEKTGVFTGAYGINPVNGKKIPIWAADYVLTGYGTGAIMAVPAHDTRDFEFAVKFGLPVICIMEPDTESGTPDHTAFATATREVMTESWKAAEGRALVKQAVLDGRECWTADGAYIRSESDVTGLNLNGKNKKQGIAEMTAWLEKNNCGTAKVNYKLRDWLFSRQRYWGEPFPILHWEDGSISLIDEADLPVELPSLQNFHPSATGESPLANATDWLTYTCPKTGRKARRETNTMPQWAGSCWYYLRYIDPSNDAMPWDPAKEKYWMPVDLYVGGAEHAVLHLLYSRFWHKVLFDLGLVSTDEPFQRLFNQGLILAFAYEDAAGSLVPSDEVIERDGKYFHLTDGRELKKIVAKMSKSLKNVVNPDEIVKEYGADSLRLYEMFIGPLDAAKPWQTAGVEGIYKFLRRVWRMIAETPVADIPMTREQLRILHATVKKVTEDTQSMNFNTAISQMMIFTNEFTKLSEMPREAATVFVCLLAPYAPHLAEELWSNLGHTDTIAYVDWPQWDNALAIQDEVEVLVQFAGKPKTRLMMANGLSAEEMEKQVFDLPEIKSALEGKTIRKVICVPGRLVNIVAN